MAPPTLPEPVPLDQIMLLSTGSGVANPLSLPPTGCQTLRGITPPWPPPPPQNPPNCKLLLVRDKTGHPACCRKRSREFDRPPSRDKSARSAVEYGPRCAPD